MTQIAKIKWTRSKKTIGKNKIVTDESIYTSDCGRFVIHQQKWGSKVWYLLDADGKPAGNFREAETLASSKHFANLIKNPDYDGD